MIKKGFKGSRGQGVEGYLKLRKPKVESAMLQDKRLKVKG